MSSARSLLRRWSFPAGGALAVAALIGVNLGGWSAPPADQGPPGPSPAPRSPLAPSVRVTTGDDHYRACRTESPTWHTTATRRSVFVYQVTVEAGVGLSPTRVTVDPVLTLRSRVTRGAGDTTPRDAEVLAAVARQHRLRLAPAGSATSAGSRRVAIPGGSTRQDRIYAIYSGQEAWSGRWTHEWCADHFWHTAGGRWTSFAPTGVDGVVLCRVDGRSLLGRYPAGSWDRRACQGT